MSNVLTWSISAGSNNSSPPDGWPENMARSAVNDAARENMAAIARATFDRSGISPSNGVLVTGGAADAITLTTNISALTLLNGFTVAFRVSAGHTNTGSCTLNVDGLGTKQLRAVTGETLQAGTLREGGIYVATYFQPVDQWLLQSTFDIATQAEAAAGSSNTKLMTPLRTQQAAAALLGMLHVRDEKAASTDGGTFTSGAWQTRVLNTVATNTITGASLATNQITLPAGTYDVWARAPGLRVDQHKAKLANITDTSDTLIGSSAKSRASDDTQSDSIVVGRFAIAGTKVFELQHRGNITRATDGFGGGTNVGVVEVYTEVIVRVVPV